MTPPQRILGRLWTLTRGNAVVTGLVLADPAGFEFRVVRGEATEWSQTCTGYADVLRVADAWRLQHEYAGWARVLTPRPTEPNDADLRRRG